MTMPETTSTDTSQLAASDTVQDPAQQQEPARQRVRITYEKGELIKFISHQDEFRLWERAVRRANLPLLYKQGFNPQPHMQFASPLGVGFTGARELLDITFSPPVPPEELAERLRAKLPPGVALHHLQEIDLKTPALQDRLIGADYTIILYAEPEEIVAGRIEESIQTCLAQAEIWRERQRKGTAYSYNLRPLIFELNYQGYDPETEEHRIFLRVQQRAGATGRPDEAVDALGFDDFARTLRRDRLYRADSPEDVAVFDAYPVVEQAAITPASPPKKRRKGKSTAEDSDKDTDRGPKSKGRSISERASDEFV